MIGAGAVRNAALLASLLIGPAPDAPELTQVAWRIRQAFLQHDFAAMLASVPTVRLRLPDEPVGSGLRGDVAAAVLRRFTRREVELAVEVAGAAVVAPGEGYVELRRRFRAALVDQEQAQQVLVSARLTADRWQIVELWIVDE